MHRGPVRPMNCAFLCDNPETTKYEYQFTWPGLNVGRRVDRSPGSRENKLTNSRITEIETFFPTQAAHNWIIAVNPSLNRRACTAVLNRMETRSRTKRNRLAFATKVRKWKCDSFTFFLLPFH